MCSSSFPDDMGYSFCPGICVFKYVDVFVDGFADNCVVVKDLSRFRRDYIEAGRFIQKTFPAFSVRFIAITDHHDSLTADQSTTSLVIPVKNFVNDSYCQDISEKVKITSENKTGERKIYRGICSLWISERP